jgi:hypothetical protein
MEINTHTHNEEESLYLNMTKKFHGCGATRSTGNTITWKELGEKRDDNAFVREVMHDSELDVETWEPAFKNMLW